ncbi:MAG: DDE-type integrase/transposase/recombinase [Chloroflexi bacterium]|nr:DDE-type integrase/transposase/recombinase [Chloroflexota bacterium]
MELVVTTPRHGEFPFQIGHIDHTELDIEVVNSTTGKNLGRPWISILQCAFSRRILAIVVTLDPPSYRTCMLLVRACVRKHHRLPQTVVVDNGKEFNSIYFESLLAKCGVTKKSRPPARRVSVPHWKGSSALVPHSSFTISRATPRS